MDLTSELFHSVLFNNRTLWETEWLHSQAGSFFMLRSGLAFKWGISELTQRGFITLT